MEMVQYKSLISTQHPSHWKVVRNKAFLSITGEVVGKRANEFVLLSLTTNGVIVRDVESGKGKFPKDFDTYQVVKPNELVFCLFDIDETPRTIGIVEKEGMLTGAYTALKVNQNRAFPLFVYYYYIAVDNIKGLKPYYSGLRKTVRADKFLQIYIPLPPLAEQEKIVSYLEGKTSKIDAYVADKEKEIELLQELKQKTIADAVTKGLNPDAKMKDSGIAWIEEIPEHWETRRAKFMFKKNKRERRPEDEVITCFRDGQVTLRKNRRLTGFTESEKYDGYQGIRKGDLVIHQMDAFAGSIGVSDSDGMGTSVYHCCTPTGDYNVYYYANLIRQMALSGFIQSLYKGIRERSSDFSFPVFGNQYLTIPPLDEQQSIVAYIEEKCEKIDKLASELQSEIDYLKEYKQRLIADCVTGQVNVQNEMI